MQVRSVLQFLAATLLACAGTSCAAEEVHEGYTGYWRTVVATAYSPVDNIDSRYHATKGDKWRWITADGRTDVRQVPYGIAVAFNRATRKPVIPFGTQVIIPAGQGYLDVSRPTERCFRVDDVGNGKEFFPRQDGRMHFDVRFRHTGTALKWGVKDLRVFIVTGVATAAPRALSPVDDLFWEPSLALR